MVNAHIVEVPLALPETARQPTAQNRKLFSVLRELSVTLLSYDRNDKYDLSTALRRWKDQRR